MDTWAATQEEHEQARRMRNVLRMHHWHGVCTVNPDTGMPDPTCGDCVHLVSVQAGKRNVFKCVI